MIGEWSNVRVLGWTNARPEVILTSASAGAGTEQFGGDFTVVGDAAGGSSVIVSSVVGSLPYYFAVGTGGKPVHGDCFYSVVRDAGFAWDWDLRALRELALLGHVTGGRTLHPRVKRVPSDSRVVLKPEGAEITPLGYWDGWPAADPESFGHALSALNAATTEALTQPPVVSMSGGFDSRAILSAVLRAGARPLLLTMGSPGGGDRAVAEFIARDLRLDLRTVELHADSYLTHAQTIVELTGGAKTVANWHTYLYTLAAAEDLADRVHLVGANGEFARSYYFDKGLVAQGVDRMGNAGLMTFFLAKVMRRKRRYPRALALVHGTDGGSAMDLAKSWADLAGAGGGNVLDQLDRFYATQRVPNFIGRGMALYAANGTPRSPFLDARWISAVRRLARVEKMGSNYHRSAIRANDPRLTEYPIGWEATMAPRAPHGYWLHRKAAAGYSAFPELARSAEVRTILGESRQLAPFIDGDTSVQEYTPSLIDLLLTIHFAGEAGEAAARA